MPDIILLPATDPRDRTYGTMPETIEACPSAPVRHVRFPSVVWYNDAVREQAIEQIVSMGVSAAVLVGFSKSGLGAWNITRAIPHLISATLIFDAPVAREPMPPWGVASFYASEAAWGKDLPARSVAAFRAAVPDTHRLVLISGEAFHDEMSLFSEALREEGVRHAFLPRPRMKHHWRSGWIEEGLSALLGQGPGGGPVV